MSVLQCVARQLCCSVDKPGLQTRDYCYVKQEMASCLIMRKHDVSGTARLARYEGTLLAQGGQVSTSGCAVQGIA